MFRLRDGIKCLSPKRPFSLGVQDSSWREGNIIRKTSLGGPKFDG